ncbi:hypothetical protein CERZMDRAFT_118785 [Cercospora zeae-maydis SCOH1-5]|uniref:MYND-type zinc finger protein samB n=1 Tax=Cercospora zeae-maydis SCOH1-5 TaxID=717836 RepID=A0A6A6F586_9PEZI|nr:hypothetical protein CERZMDRAFT_118785 [Cercospora zeae-maydis SCOH1-5]
MACRSNTCSRCSVAVPAARFVTCEHCKEGRDIDGTRSTVQYCSHRCRQSDTTHPTECDARNIRKRLYRAGSILQSLFFTWRRISFHRQIDQVENISGTLYVSRLARTEQEKKAAGIVPGPFTIFPSAIAGDDQQQKVLLSWMGCNDATQMSYQLVRNMLGGNYKVVDKNASYNVLHEVLAIDATDGNSYIIDLSGAQIGLSRPILPLEEYLRQVNARIIHVYKHERCLARTDYLLKKGLGNAQLDRIAATLFHMYEELNDCVAETEKTKESLAEVLLSKEKDYRRNRSYYEDLMKLTIQKTFIVRECGRHPTIIASSTTLDPDLKKFFIALPIDFSQRDAGSGIYKRYLEQEWDGSLVHWTPKPDLSAFNAQFGEAEAEVPAHPVAQEKADRSCCRRPQILWSTLSTLKARLRKRKGVGKASK